MSACSGHHCVCCGAGAIVGVNRKGDLWEAVCRACLAWLSDSLGTVLPQRQLLRTCNCPAVPELRRNAEEYRKIRRVEAWSTPSTMARRAAAQMARLDPEAAKRRALKREREYEAARRAYIERRSQLRKKHLSRTAVLASEAGYGIVFDAIVEAAVSVLGIPSKYWLHCADRSRDYTYTRKVVAYLTRRRTSMSLPTLGKLFQQHHTSVMYSVRWVEERIEQSDPGVVVDVDAIGVLADEILRTANKKASQRIAVQKEGAA